MGVVPIVNENDTVSVRVRIGQLASSKPCLIFKFQEIKFGDNDTLSAITSSMLHAEYLFLLTDVEALYTANPRKDPLAKPIDVVSSISAIRAEGMSNIRTHLDRLTDLQYFGLPQSTPLL